MSEDTIQIEAESLEEAREQLKSQMPEGSYLVSEEIVSDGKPKTVQAVSDTIEGAFTKAIDEVPINANVLEKKEIVTPTRKVIVIEAADENSARTQVLSEIGSTTIVEDLKLITEGKKGFLGIGKKSNQYEIELLQQAVVEVTYKPKVKISTRTISSSSIKSKVERGLALHNAKRYEEALTEFDSVLAIADHFTTEEDTKDIDLVSLWGVKGAVLADLGRFEEAVVSYDKALALKPQDAAIWTIKGSSLGNLGQYENALKTIERALELDPQYAVAWSEKGVVLKALQQDENALAAYERATEIDPEYAVPWANKGNVLSEQGRHEKALAAYEQALALDPQLAVAWMNKGAALGALNRFEEALWAYLEALARGHTPAAQGIQFCQVVLGSLSKDTLRAIQEIIKERGLRPLGNKARLTHPINERDATLLLFEDKASAESYYNKFVEYAQKIPLPFVTEIMLVSIDETKFAEKFAVVIPNEQTDERSQYKTWAEGIIRLCNEYVSQINERAFETFRSIDVLRPIPNNTDYSYELLHKYVETVFSWNILVPWSFALDSPEAQELLNDPPGQGFDP